MNSHNSARLLDALDYRSYRFNRERSPDVTPAQWAKVYGPRAIALERRYQANRAEDEALAAAEWTNTGPGYGED